MVYHQHTDDADQERERHVACEQFYSSDPQQSSVILAEHGITEEIGLGHMYTTDADRTLLLPAWLQLMNASDNQPLSAYPGQYAAATTEHNPNSTLT